MHFKSSAKLFTAILVPEVFLEIFLRERASKPLSGDIADNELRRGERERGVVFSLLTVSERRSVISGNQHFEHQFSFRESVGALRTNFHHSHECTAAVNRFAGSLRGR